jgi:uncharacterized membrane protein
MTLLVLAVGGFHAGGAFSLDRFHALGVILHAVGTVALGGAIAMAGQIFNMQEHWPSAILLWALGALGGWLLLGDWPHLAMSAILLPWWLAGEWAEAVPRALSAWPVISCGILLFAISYLSVRMPGADRREDHVRVALTWIGGLAVVPATLAVAVGRHANTNTAATEPGVLAIGWGCAILLPLGFAYIFRRRAAWMNLATAIWVVGLNLAAQVELDVLLYVWCAVGSVAMVAWGIYEFRAERINLGMAGFALTIAFFFFSSVMDRLGRSASLMALGILFVGGGWYWEKLRRKLVAGLVTGGVQ